MRALILLLCAAPLMAAEVLNLTLADGRTVNAAQIVEVTAYGIKYMTHRDGTRVITLPLSALAAKDAARFEPRVKAAVQAMEQAAREAEAAEQRQREAAMKNTFEVPAKSGAILGVKGFELEPSKLVVKFSTYYGEKRVAMNELPQEWQDKILREQKR